MLKMAKDFYWPTYAIPELSGTLWNWMIVFVVSGIVCLVLVTGSEWGIQCSMLRIFTVVNLCLM